MSVEVFFFQSLFSSLRYNNACGNINHFAWVPCKIGVNGINRGFILENNHISGVESNLIPHCGH